MVAVVLRVICMHSRQHWTNWLKMTYPITCLYWFLEVQKYWYHMYQRHPEGRKMTNFVGFDSISSYSSKRLVIDMIIALIYWSNSFSSFLKRFRKFSDSRKFTKQLFLEEVLIHSIKQSIFALLNASKTILNIHPVLL